MAHHYIITPHHHHHHDIVTSSHATHLGAPAYLGLRCGDVGLPLARVVLGLGQEADGRVALRQLLDQ